MSSIVGMACDDYKSSSIYSACTRLDTLEALYKTIEDLINLIYVNINIQMLMLIDINT